MSLRLASGNKVGEKYSDGEYEYRNVILSDENARSYKHVYGRKVLTDYELQCLGVTNNKELAGFEHYGVFLVEPNCLMLRKKLRKEPTKAVNSKSIRA